MSTKRLTVQEQAVEAIRIIDQLFFDDTPPIPEGMTLEVAWAELCRIKHKISKPKKVDVVRMILEDERLTGLSIPLIADIIKKVFARHSVSCDTSESSIRWYISQKTLEWNIKPREKSGILN